MFKVTRKRHYLRAKKLDASYITKVQDKLLIVLIISG